MDRRTENLVFGGAVFFLLLLARTALNVDGEEKAQSPQVRVSTMGATSVANAEAPPLPLVFFVVDRKPRAPRTVAPPSSPPAARETAEGRNVPLAAGGGEGTTNREPSPALAVKSAAVLAKRLSSDEPLLAFGADRRWPLASITKLMTALVVSEHPEKMPPGAAITVSEADVAKEGNAGSFRAGEVFRAGDLVRAMLIISSNDSASALAAAYGREALLKDMEIKARELGMRETTFADESGLSFLNQSTARDLERLVRYLADRRPELLAATAAPEAAITEVTSGRARSIKNVNFFAGRADFAGGKTGSTPEAKENLVSLFRRGGETYLIIVLGSDDRFAVTEEIYRMITQAPGR